MSQAESEPTTAESFAAFASFLGTPLPENPIAALRILRREAAAEVERLIAFLDALGGDPDLEPTMGYVAPGYVDEAEPDFDDEPSLGWTSTLNQTSRNRLGRDDDAEQDDADHEPSLGATNAVDQSRWGEGASRGYDIEGEHDGREPDVDDEDGGDTEAAVPPSPDYMKRLNARRPRRRTEHGFHNLTDLDGNPVKLIRPF